MKLLQGIPHLIFVEGLSCKEDGQNVEGWAAVKEAITSAALIVTEIMPTPPYTTWKQVKLIVESICISLLLQEEAESITLLAAGFGLHSCASSVRTSIKCLLQECLLIAAWTL